MTATSQFIDLLQRQFNGDASLDPTLKDIVLGEPLEDLVRGMLSGPKHLMLPARDVLMEARRDELTAFLNRVLISQSEPVDHRINASWLLKDLCSRDSVACVRSILKDPSSGLALQAAVLDMAERLFFGGIATDEDVREVLASIGSSPDALVQWRIVRLLGTSELEWSLDCLERYVNSADEEVASEALRMLAEHRCSAARERFAHVLNVVPERLRSVAETLRQQQSSARVHARVELVVAGGGLLQAKDIDALIGGKQYALILQLLQDAKIDATGLAALSALNDSDEPSKNQRKLIRRIVSIRDASLTSGQ